MKDKVDDSGLETFSKIVEFVLKQLTIVIYFPYLELTKQNKILKFIFSICIVLILTGCSEKVSSDAEPKTILPSALIDGRFYLNIPTISGDTILGFCDTGGGYTAIYNSTVENLGIKSKVREVKIKNSIIRYVPAEDIYNNEIIPYPKIIYEAHIEKQFFEVPDYNQEWEILLEFIPQDAFLGQFFFIKDAWTFDYMAGKIYINTPLFKDSIKENIQELGFKKNLFGKKKFGHPRMQLEIEGEVLDFLFDTGASILLSEKGRGELDAVSKSIGGSFIGKTIFEKWQRNHPEWRVIKKGELMGADLIEVPQVTVGNLTAGPVWFAVRPDEAFSITTMDKVVQGAIGGSFLQYFSVTIDYNSELILFEKR